MARRYSTNLTASFTNSPTAGLGLIGLLTGLAAIVGCGTSDPQPPTPSPAGGGEDPPAIDEPPGDKPDWPHVTEVNLPVNGASLWTYVSLPENLSAAAPILVERTPYLAEGYLSTYEKRAAAYNGRGYGYVLQAVRGTFRSSGEFLPYATETEDGAALVSWTLQQPWCNGQVGTIGCSYPGYCALAAAAGDARVRAVFADGPVESDAFELEGGLPSLGSLSWLYYIKKGIDLPDTELSNATNALKVRTLDEELLGQKAPIWQDIVADPTPTAPWLDQLGIGKRYGDICSPVLVADSGERGSHWVWRHLFERGCVEAQDSYRLLFQPGLHCAPSKHLIEDPSGPEGEAIWSFLDHHLRGAAPSSSWASKVLYRTAAGEPLTPGDTFPPPSTELSLYLHAIDGEYGGDLSSTDPGEAFAAEFPVDPESTDACTSKWQLLYTSAPFASTQTIVDRPRLVFWGASDRVDADFFALAYVVETEEIFFSGGIRARYRTGYESPIALTPGEPAELEILGRRMAATRVQEGQRVALMLRGDLCGYVENPHTGEPLGDATQRLISNHAVHTGPATPSRLVLSVVEP